MALPAGCSTGHHHHGIIRASSGHNEESSMSMIMFMIVLTESSMSISMFVIVLTAPTPTHGTHLGSIVSCSACAHCAVQHA